MTALANNLTLPRSEQAQLSGLASRVAWGLFLVLNASLFLRPADIFPQLEGLPIYEVNIILCLGFAAPALFARLRARSLAVNPITLCVMGMLLAVVASLLTKGDGEGAQQYGAEFAKVVLYYLLLVSLVDSTRRLRQLLLAIAVYALALNLLALLTYHHVLALPTLEPMPEVQTQVDPASGERTQYTVLRLQAAGIYGNPNDLSRLIVVGMTLCLYAMGAKPSWLTWAIWPIPLGIAAILLATAPPEDELLPVIAGGLALTIAAGAVVALLAGASLRACLSRLAWLAPLTIFAYALKLTYSRGGLLALMSAIAVLFHARYGMKKGGIAILLLLPVLAVFSGRQTDIDTSSGTGLLRIQLWSEGLVAMRSSPALGIGAGRYFAMAGNHAHNSFIESYVETGFVGGTFFAGAFYMAATGLFRRKPEDLQVRDPELWRLRPYILSLVVGTIISQMSSSREYSPPTYMILGLATAYLFLATKHAPWLRPRLSWRLAGRLLIVSACTLVGLHLYTKFNAHFG